MSIIIFLAVLAVLVLVHEFGHFIVAKKSGIRVDEFGLGFPPKLFSKKWGETTYTINAIPFGGFVKIFGEDAHTENITDAQKPRSFVYKPKWIQALVLVAGVTFNIIFAWLLISLGFAIGLEVPVDYSNYGKAQDIRLIVTEVIPSSPALKADIHPGDVIVSISSSKGSLTGDSVTPENVQNLIGNSQSGVDVTFKRGQNTLEVSKIIPETIGGRKAIGIAMDSVGTLKLPIHLALFEGTHTTLLLIKGTTIGLLKFLWSIVVFKSDFSQVTGPVGIATVVGEASRLGFTYLISLVALISINLAIINLLPFPALDGGRLLFVAVEAIIRKPISPKFVRVTNFVGFVLLIMLMIIVTTHDILKLF
jgi:regulator of sigma E protease